MEASHGSMSTFGTTKKDGKEERFIEISKDGNAYAFRLPEPCEDVEVDPSELWRRAWTKDGSSITKLVLPASFCLSEGLQSRFKFLLGLMERMDEDCMKGMRVIDLSMNGLMLNFLLHSINGLSELRVLDISGNFVQEDKLMEFLSSSVQCYALNISLLDMKRLPPRINIDMLRFLMLDNNPLIEAIPVDCFASLKYLERLSMCATGISDLWTTVDGLSKLPALKHVRFQRCSEEESDGIFWDEPSEYWEGKDHALMIWRRSAGGYRAWGEREANLLLSKYEMYPHYANALEKENCNGEEDAIHQKVFETFLVRRQSPICLQKGYRQFLTLRLPNLVSLDGMRVGPLERAGTSGLEGVPRCGLSHVLGYREIGGLGPGRLPIPNTRKTRDMDGRMLCSQSLFHKVGNWPRIREICPSAEQPRQFEYHPTIPGIVAIGTADNHLMVHNWKRNLILGKEEMSISVGDHRWSSVLGISWLNRHPGLLLAGSDNGTIRLFDVSVLSAPDRSAIRGKHNFTRFPDLTSISINCSDAYFVASGYSNDVALYETCTQKLINVFKNLHSDHINVIRFSHHSPSLLATSSFDRDVKMWDLRTNMLKPILKVTSDAGNLTIGFSHNDQFLLSSATDNDVRQYLISDGRLHTKLDIEPTGNCNNFTRSYYMADADYIITGSCEQPGARVCSARTGKVLRQVTFECEDCPRMIAGVQSLRADPLDDLKFAVLTSTEEHLPNSSKMLEVDMASCFSGG